MKKRLISSRKHLLSIAKLKTELVREEARRNGVHPLKLHLVVSEEENNVRKNHLGSRYFRSIYPTKPLTTAMLDELLEREAKDD